MLLDDGSTVNSLFIESLGREDMMMVLTCRAVNNNITEPKESSITIDLNRKYTEFIRILSG